MAHYIVTVCLSSDSTVSRRIETASEELAVELVLESLLADPFYNKKLPSNPQQFTKVFEDFSRK